MTADLPNLAIRRAGLDDADTLSALAARTFTETFGHLYPPEDLRHFLDETYSAESHRRLLADPAYAFWLLEREDGEAAGYALAGACGLPHGEVLPQDGELKRLYVLQSLHNGGWGGRLFRASLDWLEREGPRTLWIGVWSQNLGAQRFYERHGFRRVGEYEFPVGRVRDLEFILRREASARPAQGAAA
ncbi:GNAT family N-acetyltransferase [Luteimonas aquatica]|uniref:GNAT family N-acetyltransferase n=1 Tax=Luteimonas aquatica TaxID=450364 RepID=UPI001F599E58|nr:GNAT family N-acetyltransferase [Luteimonas aquatica]